MKLLRYFFGVMLFMSIGQGASEDREPGNHRLGAPVSTWTGTAGDNSWATSDNWSNSVTIQTGQHFEESPFVIEDGSEGRGIISNVRLEVEMHGPLQISNITSFKDSVLSFFLDAEKPGGKMEILSSGEPLEVSTSTVNIKVVPAQPYNGTYDLVAGFLGSSLRGPFESFSIVDQEGHLIQFVDTEGNIIPPVINYNVSPDSLLQVTLRGTPQLVS